MPPNERIQALRAIDANANRATEALRVVEDHARFARNDKPLSEALKVLRHDLTAALDIVPIVVRLAARDTAGDVGTDLKTPAEYVRQNLSEVAAANWKRAAQALRSLEEFTKPWWPQSSERLEQLRYRLYSLEKMAETSRAAANRIQKSRLYVLCSGLSNEREFAERIERLVEAQVDAVQLRDKQLADRELLSRAELLKCITAGTHTLFIMNDRADLAYLTGADGVHVGQQEISIPDARSILGRDKLIGASTHSVQQALDAERDGADYIGCGPVFASSTKQFSEVAGLELLRDVHAKIQTPAFAIGGITLENLARVLECGFSRVAVQNAIWEAKDPGEAARRFLDALGVAHQHDAS